VDQQHGGIGRELLEQPALQPAGLDAGAAEAFGAMGAGLGEEQAAGILRSQPGGLGAEVAAIWTFRRIGIAAENGARCARGLAETLAGLGKCA